MLRLRHGGLRLEDLHPGGALPWWSRAGAPDGRAAQQARRAADHDEGPEQGHRRRERGGDLRPRRHDHVDQRGRAVPVGPAAGAGTAGQLAEVAQVLRRLPGYLLAEQQRPGQLPAGGLPALPRVDLAALEHRVDTTMAPAILSRLSPEALQRITEHRAAGHTTILITGAVRTFTRPLQELFDVIVAAELAVDDDGRCTGFLTDAAAGRGVPGRLAQALRRPARHRPVPQLRVRGLPLRPADAVHRRPPGRGQPGHRADAGRAAQPVVHRGVEDQARPRPRWQIPR